MNLILMAFGTLKWHGILELEVVLQRTELETASGVLARTSMVSGLYP